MTYNELKNEENKYVMNTYGRFPIALDHGKGATLWDVEGKKYIDLASGIGGNCLPDRFRVHACGLPAPRAALSFAGHIHTYRTTAF